MELDLRHYKNEHSRRSKYARAFWNVVWMILFRPTPNRIGAFNRWRAFLLRCFGANIGRHTAIYSSVSVWQPWKLKVGDWVALSHGVKCYTVDTIEIGNNTTVSDEVFLDSASHDISSPVMELKHAPIKVGSNCWLGARAIILPGRVLGDGAVVAAGAVVTKDVEPWTVVGGNPAGFIKKRELRIESK
ncbi:MAG: putative colanic acid biosynthesis acetyltransferase [Kiritimatiellae bacterium]|nr:putative colanic acid biosynthesis acetyltransferase [Kiritimatiellia bacterium]